MVAPGPTAGIDPYQVALHDISAQARAARGVCRLYFRGRKGAVVHADFIKESVEETLAIGPVDRGVTADAHGPVRGLQSAGRGHGTIQLTVEVDAKIGAVISHD